MTKIKSIMVRVLDEEVAIWKRDFPNLVTAWGLRDEEIVTLVAAEKMMLTCASKPAEWVVRERNVCDESVMGWRVELAPEHQYPAIPGQRKRLDEGLKAHA